MVKTSEERKSSVQIVLCDEQEQYSENLLKLLVEKLPEEYQLHLFSDIKKLREFSERSMIDIVLISEGYGPDERKSIHSLKRYILTEKKQDHMGGELWKYNNTLTHEADKYTEIPIFRYQSADQIMNIILGKTEKIKKYEIKNKKETDHSHADKTGREKRIILREEKSTQGEADRNRKFIKGIIGIYSPIHRIGKTRFAFRLGKQMAEHFPVLYLNLEEYSGGSFYYPEKQEQDIGDLLYYMRQENANLGLKISTITGQADGLDYIMPMKYAQDLRAISAAEWLELIELIMEKCIYEAVILDLGQYINGLYDILKRCTRVYTPYIEDQIELAKLEQYEEELRTSGYEDVLRHTIKRRMGRSRLPP